VRAEDAGPKAMHTLEDAEWDGLARALQHMVRPRPDSIPITEHATFNYL